jgi:hypothetical protein
MQKVVCNAGCQKEFVLIEVGTARIGDDIEAVGFTCPHCGHFYGHYQNEKIRRLQEEQRELLQRGKRAQGKALRRLLQLIENKKAEISAEMNRLRAIVEGGAHG